MKKLYILLFIIPLIFTSCETDDDNQNNVNNNVNDTSGSILGTWELTFGEVTYDDIYLHPVNGTEVIQETSIDPIPSPFFITFRNDNTFERIITDQNDPLENDTLTGIYLKTNDILEFDVDSGVEYNITTLNDYTLSFNGFIDDTVSINPDLMDDTTFIYRETVFFDFSRLTGRSSNNFSSIKKSNSSENSFGLLRRYKSSNK